MTAFLDKFMEKKPKQSTWHGGSQIEPAKQVKVYTFQSHNDPFSYLAFRLSLLMSFFILQMDVNNQLIGAEILSLAEEDVPPEDLVFHKFYTNKMSSTSKTKKKKKKSADEEAAEELFDIDDGEVDGGDESDNEEIENLLDSTDPSVGQDNDYDYDDLDEVAGEEDEDLIGDVSDGEMDMDIPSDIGEEEDDAPIDDVGIDDDDDGIDIQVGDVDDGSDGDGEEVGKRKRKHKSGGKKGVSPFASYEEFEHLMEDEDHTEKKASPKKNKSNKSKKRKK